MSAKIYFRDVKGIGGLDWITVVGVPHTKSEKHGYLLHADILSKCEFLVARYILTHNSPIRGIELKFLRKKCGLSARAFATAFGVTAPTILEWEGAKERQLSKATEIAVRLFFAERLNINLNKSYSELIGLPDPIVGTLIDATDALKN